MDESIRALIRAQCHMVLSDVGDPYEAAREMWRVSFGSVSRPNRTADDDAWAHWLIWGALSDWVEARPSERVDAEAAIRDAAREWIAVEGDPNAEGAFFDRLVYEVCGYARPAQPGGHARGG